MVLNMWCGIRTNNKDKEVKMIFVKFMELFVKN